LEGRRSRKRHGLLKPPVRSRLVWHEETERLLIEGQFEQCYRMSTTAFERLLALVGPALHRDPHSWLNKQGVSEANKLQMLVRYLAGGSVDDIRRVAGVSRSYTYRLLIEAMNAVIGIKQLKISFPMSPSEREHAAAAFALESNQGIVVGCIAAMDGWLCAVRAPPSRAADGAGPRAYYSGHYSRMGINVQACCDALSRFVYLDASHPGGTNDIRAYRESALPRVVEGLEDGLFVAGDNAYKATDHLLTPFLASELLDKYRDSFNFHLSQLRIRIEMAFGLLVKKWGIFQRPVQTSLEHATKVVHCAAILHNYTITARLENSDDPVIDELRSGATRTHVTMRDMLTYAPSDQSEGPTVRSFVREGLVEKLRQRNQLRPYQIT
jgi:hypothetical protein